jgi:glucose-6-phosphate isomerase
MLKFTNQTKHSYQSENEPALDQLIREVIQSDRGAFFHLDNFPFLFDETKAVYKKFKNKKHFVQVGIGGSALGPQMLVDALKTSDIHFTFLDNIDSDYLKNCLDQINLSEAIFYIVSKSGTTAETMAVYFILRNLLKQNGITENEFQNYFVFCTDPEVGDLKKISKEENITCLTIPSSLGGRYSVLSPVGLLPAIFAGADLDKIFKAISISKKILLEPKSALFQTADIIFNLYKSHGINQTVLMPYSSKLKTLSSWFVQLWAESLGKLTDNQDHNSGIGITPIPAFGATDQHSQMQLFMQGPNDKCLILLRLEQFTNDFKLSNNLDITCGKRLEHTTLNQLMEAEFKGTIKALNEAERNTLELSLTACDETNLTEVILFLQCLTVLVGKMLKIDPFDQPGVEKGKIYAYDLLKEFK